MNVPSPAGGDFDHNLLPDDAVYGSGDAFSQRETPLAQLALSPTDIVAKGGETNGAVGDNCSIPEPETTTELFADLSIAEANGGATQMSNLYQKEICSVVETFTSWMESDQVAFVQHLLTRMTHPQLGAVDDFLRPMLMRDFISNLPRGLSEQILQYLDARGLRASEEVSRAWKDVVAFGQLWRKLIEKKVRTDSMWRGLAEKRNWTRFLLCGRVQNAKAVCDHLNIDYERFKNSEYLSYQLHEFYRRLYPRIRNEIERVEDNWKHGRHTHRKIDCQSENSRGVYCLQYDDQKIVSGLRDNTIKVWNREDLSMNKVLTGHTGSVLCLQYDNRIIISGSSDATVRVWDIETGECLNTLIHHGEAVLHLRFGNGTMVTCSKDRSIAVWDMVSPQEITVRRVLIGHRAAVNAVDFDNTHIVSGSGDRTIKVWSVDQCEFLRTLSGHRRGIACLQYRDGLVVSGSSDNTIRLWEIMSGTCIRVLDGHNELVRCIRFDSKRIISGAYDGKIKIWDLKAALDPRAPQSAFCLATLAQHQGRVFRLQFDEFQIVSSSHDDTIVVWDFLNTEGAEVPQQALPPVAAAGAHAIGVDLGPLAGADVDVDVDDHDHDGYGDNI